MSTPDKDYKSMSTSWLQERLTDCLRNELQDEANQIMQELDRREEEDKRSFLWHTNL